MLLEQLEIIRSSIIVDSKKEYELIYSCKEREQDILSNTMAVPLQKVKTFRNGIGENAWTNKLIFGDNLQILKTLLQMKDQGNLRNADGTPGIRLIYIDPPFATKQEFRGSQDQKAYQDKIAGANFVEFLRKRLIFLKELLSDDGSIFVHLDYRKKHYIKAIMDEIYGENKFRNEIAVSRIKKNIREREKVKKLNEEFDTILFYSNSDSAMVLPPTRKDIKPGRWHGFEAAGYRKGMDFEMFGYKPAPDGHWRWTKDKAFEAKENYEKWETEFSKSETLENYWTRTGANSQFIRPNRTSGKPEYFIPSSGETLCNNLWNDISAYSFSCDYPTEKSESLLERIINMASNKGDLILDCFAGSGTALAVAEKCARRWIGVDCGKLAIYTIQKRLLNMGKSRQSNGITGKYNRHSQPFTLYNAGLYDYKIIKELAWDSYREFALKLFQCRDEKHEISKIHLDGYMEADSVLVFNYQKYKDAMMDRDFIEDLHKYLGDKIGRRFFIIAPSASVRFLEDYIEKGRTKYYILRIPYSIIEELHNNGFSKIKQPVSELDVNDTVEAIGFDFVQAPKVECTYLMENKKGQLEIGKPGLNYVIKIEKFESKIITRKAFEYKNLQTLSMVMIDYNFDGEVFDLDKVYYAEDLAQNEYKIEMQIAKSDIQNQMMIIFIDLFGNELRRIISGKDFLPEQKKA